MKIFAMTNQKGGVWKTSTTLNLGAALAGMGKRVLLVDMDPSGDLTTHAGIELQDGDRTIYEVLTDGVPVSDAVRTVHGDRTGTDYDVVPADSALADLDSQDGERLRAALEAASGRYDYVLIDTPPSVGAPIVAAMGAADELIIPAMPSLLSLSAVAALQDTVRDMQGSGLNPDLKVAGVVLTDYRPRSVHHRDVAETMRDALQGAVFDTTISNSIAAVEAAGAGTDVFEYAAGNARRRRSPVIAQYRDLAAELTGQEAHGGTE